MEVPPNTKRSFLVASTPKSLRNSAIRDFGYTLASLSRRSKFIGQPSQSIESGSQIYQYVIQKELVVFLLDPKTLQLPQHLRPFRKQVPVQRRECEKTHSYFLFLLGEGSQGVRTV